MHSRRKNYRIAINKLLKLFQVMKLQGITKLAITAVGKLFKGQRRKTFCWKIKPAFVNHLFEWWEWRKLKNGRDSKRAERDLWIKTINNEETWEELGQ